ncbi:TonB-dependent siderophore receptor [Lewinella sp. 4G2]|uniref:TonB-dependent receptor plug domain-containing protein n=1 Tax=Lewinella sp. 4G2 TaxID=1803372 RepID=UPI0007B4C3BD|nr:TonB-dependent receptor [Lewinella sp. 4G2]OAV45357.1 hypothetical protein A3850_013030 [Lewinella sp. 4G2]
MTKRILLFLSFCSTLSLGLAAQEAPELTTTGDEVIITGTRFPKQLDRSTTKVTIIDSATVARNTDLGQLLNEQAGIVVNGAYSAPGKDRSIFLRNGANQYTLILLDGQPLIDPSSLGGAVDLRLLDLQGIERIEIVHGAQSLIYGSDAVAGVINLISKANSDDPTVTLRASYGSFDTFEAGADARGRKGKLAYALGFNVYDSKGISEAIFSPEQLADPLFDPAPLERDGARRYSGNAAFTYHASEHWTIRPSIRYAQFDGDYDDGAFQDSDANTYENELVNPALAIDYAEPGFAAGLRYNYVATDRLFSSAFGDFDFAGRAQQADVFGNKSWKNLALTLGAQARIEKLTLDNPPVDADDNVTTLSPYLQAEFRTDERWFAEAAIRYNNHSTFGGQLNYSTGFAYQVIKGFTVRGTYATAFQSPTLDQLYGPFGANAELEPQTSSSIEAGFAYRNEERDYGFSVTGFQRTIEDVIIFGNPGYLNRDELDDLGVEVEAFAKLGEQLSINGNFTYVEGELTSEDFSGNPTTTEDFFRRPRVSGLFGLTYTPSFPLTARLTTQYTGDRPDVFFDASFNQNIVELDPYLLVNFYVEYKLLAKQNLTLFADLRNLTDTDFVEVTGFATQGRTVRTGARYTIGK